MTHRTHQILALAAACAAMFCTSMADEPKGASDDPAHAFNFDRYKSIIDRMPFGEPPLNFDPTAPAGAGGAGTSANGGGSGMTEAERTEEEQRIAAAVRVSMINVTPSGTVAVGFTDSSSQPPVHYYLAAGKSRDGWTVVSADPAEQSVVLSKDDVEVTLKLGEGTSGKGDAKKGGRPANTRMPVPRHPAAMGAATPPRGGGALAQLRARKEEQAREEASRRQAAAQAEAEEKAERAREAEERAIEREQQRAALLQIQEELRRSREQREAEQRQREQQQTNEDGGDEGNN